MTSQGYTDLMFLNHAGGQELGFAARLQAVREEIFQKLTPDSWERRRCYEGRGVGRI